MIGDAYQVFGSAVSNAALLVQPAVDIEVIIHNIYHSDDIELAIVNGTNEMLFYAEAGENFSTNMYLHLTNTQFLKVYNRSGATKFISVDGVITKSV